MSRLLLLMCIGDLAKIRSLTKVVIRFTHI